MNPIAVLLSAGLDSAVLGAAEARHAQVHPIYVSSGLAWEADERAMLARLLKSTAFAGVQPLKTLDVTIRDVYPEEHWAVRGTPPPRDTPDADVYLAGRNLILLTKAAVYCAQLGIERIALALLAGNPFPDATPEFLAAISHSLSLGLAHRITVDTPFRQMRKADVIRLGARLDVPLELTLSCMAPRDGSHCGRCSKCRERADAFREAGLVDPAPHEVTSGR